MRELWVAKIDTSRFTYFLISWEKNKSTVFSWQLRFILSLYKTEFFRWFLLMNGNIFSGDSDRNKIERKKCRERLLYSIVIDTIFRVARFLCQQSFDISVWRRVNTLKLKIREWLIDWIFYDLSIFCKFFFFLNPDNICWL